MWRVLLVTVCMASVLNAGCGGLLGSTSTSPTSDQLSSGQWSSVSSVTTLTDICTDFHWTISTLSPTSAEGAFTAKCRTSIQATGTAHASISGSTLTWTATATGAGAGGSACQVSLTSTASFDGTQIRIPYTGTTCLGAVSGVEYLRKS